MFGAPSRVVCDMEIAKAVVLAGACSGSTIWPSVGFAVRQLAPVANRPVLFHHLDALAAAGVREAAVVTDSTTGPGIREALGDGSDWELELLHVEDEGPVEPFASPAVAEFVGTAPVLVHHGDVLLSERLSALKDDFADRSLDALLLRSGALDIDPDHLRYAGYLIGPALFPELRCEAPALEDMLRRLTAGGARIGVREVDACMPCRGGTEQLLEANRRMLEQMRPGHRSERVFGSQVQGPVALHPTAEVRDSIIRGPVAIGPGACIADAYVGPYTSIGADVELEGIEIEHSIVLDGAQMRFLAPRVEGSLIGPRARVTRDFYMPRAVRLSIGEGARVSLAA
jgi:glucose-1-phosphate thymidylyltransferase